MKRRPFLVSCAVLTVLLVSSSQVSADWKIKSDVDLYKEPGGKGKPVGIVRKGKVFLDTQVKCRSDKWCNIPQGWIWGSFLKKVDATGGSGGGQICANLPLSNTKAAKSFKVDHPECKSNITCDKTDTAFHCCCTK